MSLLTSRDVDWVETLRGTQPHWPLDREPQVEAIEHIARKHLCSSSDLCTATFFAEGGFNKLYRISVPRSEPGNGASDEYIVRVSLPVEPVYKTLSEEATLAFVRRHTELVPRVSAFDAQRTGDNELGFEWILMELKPGRPLADVWNVCTWSAKEDVVRTLVGVLARLFNERFLGIGNLYRDAETAGADRAFTVGRIVSMEFFWDKHAQNTEVSRGPFACSHDWLAARLQLALADAGALLREAEDEDDAEDAEAGIVLAQRLLAKLPSIFSPIDSPSSDSVEQSALFHDDMSWHNLLADDAGVLTGIVDWECVSTLPLWRVCQIPAFLDGRPRPSPPSRDSYAVDEDGETNEMYAEHVREHEETLLRDVFVDVMSVVAPEWVQIWRESRVKADFDLAVQLCGDELSLKRIGAWLDDLDSGEENLVGLRERFWP